MKTQSWVQHFFAKGVWLECKTQFLGQEKIQHNFLDEKLKFSRARVCLSLLEGMVQANIGLLLHISGNANLKNQQSVNLEEWFKILPQWIWIWCKKVKCRKMN